MLAAALSYARRGWPVFPCRPRGKEPLTAHGFKDATTDPATIRSWWQRWPDANVALATGRVSGLVVLDVDMDKGGLDSLRTLVDRFAGGELPEGPAVQTGGGGYHLYFAYPAAPVPCSAGKAGPGLDLRGDGGYVIAPPSVHPSGGRYTWGILRWE